MFKQILIAIACILAVQSIRTTDPFKGQQKPLQDQHMQYFDGQILDHFNPIPQKTWKQRYYVLPDYFEPETGPMFLYICGESTCKGMPESRTFTKELAEIHGGIVVTLEHRFYGQSQPFGQDENSYSTENLKYLSQYQGLADLAYFIGYIKEKGLYGIHKDTPVITVGGSYPGAMSAWFRYQYKHLTVGAYASSAVVEAIEDFQQYDMQIGISASVSGAYCPDDIKKLNSYVERQLQDPETAAALKKQFKAQDLGDLEFLEMFADIFSGLVQYGKASEMCENYLKNKTIDQQLQALSKEASDPDSYTVEYLQQTAYDESKNSRQWFYQTCTAFGWFQTADEENPFRSTLIDVQYYETKCQEVFGDEYLPNVPLTNVMMGGDEMNVSNIVFTNGGEDPWKHASILKDQPPMKAYVAECQGCAHCCDLSTPSPSDPAELKYVRQEVKQNIALWLEEYRKELYQDEYYKMDFKTKKQELDQDLVDFQQKLKEGKETEVEKLIKKYVKVY